MGFALIVGNCYDFLFKKFDTDDYAQSLLLRLFLMTNVIANWQASLRCLVPMLLDQKATKEMMA